MKKKDITNKTLWGGMCLLIVLLSFITSIGFNNIDHKINMINLDVDHFEDIEVIRLFDCIESFDKFPENYVCTKNVLVTEFPHQKKIFFSTFHLDERGTRDNELGHCFVKWK